MEIWGPQGWPLLGPDAGGCWQGLHPPFPRPWLHAVLSCGLFLHRLFPHRAKQAADEGFVGGRALEGQIPPPLLVASVLEPGAENSTHTCMEGTGGAGWWLWGWLC